MYQCQQTYIQCYHPVFIYKICYFAEENDKQAQYYYISKASSCQQVCIIKVTKNRRIFCRLHTNYINSRNIYNIRELITVKMLKNLQKLSNYKKYSAERLIFYKQNGTKILPQADFNCLWEYLHIQKSKSLAVWQKFRFSQKSKDYCVYTVNSSESINHFSMFLF